MTVVLEGVPVWQAVDELCGAVEKFERGGGLLFVGRQKVRCEVFQGLEELDELLAHAVVGVVGGGTAAKGEGCLERRFVLGQDAEGGRDAGPRGSGDDLVANVGMALADGLQEVAHLVGAERLEQAWQRKGAAGYVCAHALHATGWGAGEDGGRGRGGGAHAVVFAAVAVVFGLALAARHGGGGRQDCVQVSMAERKGAAGMLRRAGARRTVAGGRAAEVVQEVGRCEGGILDVHAGGGPQTHWGMQTAGVAGVAGGWACARRGVGGM